MRKIFELSADLGEATTDEERLVEAAIWPLVDAANVACGGHAGDATSMADAADRAAARGIHLGAHPSYPDRASFGRRSMTMLPDDLRATLAAQIAELRAIAATRGVTLRHVKPHGALYNDAHRNLTLATIIIEAMRQVDPELAIVASSTSQMAAAACAAGTPVIAEAFADRRYESDGSLRARGKEGALLTVDEAAQQALQLVKLGSATAADGTRLGLTFDTLCVHADMEGSVERLRAIRAILGKG